MSDSEPPYSCVDCDAGFDTLKQSEEHQCLGTEDHPIDLTASPSPLSTCGSEALCGMQSLEMPELQPFFNAGDSSRITCLEGRAFSDMSASTVNDESLWETRYNSGPVSLLHITRKYRYALWKSHDLREIAMNLWHCESSATVRGVGTLAPATLSCSSTLVGPAITIHAVLSSAVKEARRPVSPTTLLAFATCLEDLGSYMCLALTLSRTRRQELQYLTRIVSVSLPPSIDFASFLASLITGGVVTPNGKIVLSGLHE